MHNKSFGKHIKLARLKNQLKPQELATQANLSIETIWSIESGKRTPSIDTLITLSNILHVSPEYLLSADINSNFVNALQYSELSNVFDLTLSEFKRIEDIVKIILEKDLE